MKTLNKTLKHLIGLDKIEEERAKLTNTVHELEILKNEIESERTSLASERTKLETLKNKKEKTPKDIATSKNEPWVSVLNTNISKDNPTNGFFELDWNRQFVDYLILHGFGAEGDPEEEVVDRWFRTLAMNMLEENGYHSDLGAGIIK